MGTRAEAPHRNGQDAGRKPAERELAARLGELGIRMGACDAHLVRLARHLAAIGRPAEALAVDTARTLLDGRCPRCLHRHLRPPCCTLCPPRRLPW